MLKARRKTFILTAALAVACSQKTTNPAISVDPARGGNPLVTVNVKYTDLKPTISDDGTKVVFISGRDTVEGQVPTSKAYKATWPAGVAPQPPTRATATDLGVEQDARVSPDGLWIVVQVAKANVIDLYLQDFAGAKAAVKLPDTNTVKTAMAFSPDSKLLSWISGDGTKTNAAAMVVAIGDGSAAALASPVALAPNVKSVFQLFWQPATSGYKLIVATPTTAGQTVFWDYTPYAFAAAPAAATATAGTILFKSLRAAGEVPPSATATNILLAAAIVPNSALPLEREGVPLVINEPAFPAPDMTYGTYPLPTLAAAGGDDVKRHATHPLGYQMLRGFFTQDGANAIYLERDIYNVNACLMDPVGYYTFGGRIAVAPTDLTNPNPDSLVTEYVPRLLLPSPVPANNDIPFAFDVANDFCDRPVRADGTYPRVDNRVEDLAVNGAAKAAVFRAAYVTRFTTHFDGNCLLKDGNPEVMLIDVGASARTIYQLSNNRPPLAEFADDDRGGYAPCTL